MSRLDPKPGRWILPLVVAGIIGFTAVFVNALPPADEVAIGEATTTTEEPDEPDATTTTTTLSPQIAEFLVAADGVAAQAENLLTQAEEINQTWEDDRNFNRSLNDLEDLAERTVNFAQGVTDTNVPADAANAWVAVQEAADQMVVAADDMVRGLQAPDTGQIRRAALGELGIAVEDLTDAVAAAQEAVT